MKKTNTGTKLVKSQLITVEKQSNQKIVTQASIKGLQEPPYKLAQLAEMYGFNGYHSKCINIKAVITAGLGYELINTEDETVNEEDQEAKKIREFIDNHSKYANQTFTETLINFQTDEEIFGHAFFEVVRNNKGEVSEIYHIPAKDVKVGYNTDTKKVFIAQVINESEITFTPFGDDREEGKNEFLMLKNYNPQSRFYGLPSYIGALGAIILDRNGVEYNIYKFNNSAVPDSVIIVKGAALDQKTQENIKAFFANNYKGNENAGRSLILTVEDSDAVIEVKPVGADNKDSSFRGMRLDARDEIISAHGVPKRLIGIAESGGLGGQGEGRSQLKIFQDCVIEPKQSRLEFLLNERIIKQGLGITKWKIKLNSLYIEDPAADASYYAILLDRLVLDVNEVREELGYAQKKIDENAVAQETIKSLKNIQKQLAK